MAYRTGRSAKDNPYLSLRVLSVYIAQGENRVLGVKDVWRRVNPDPEHIEFKYETVRAAIRNLHRQNLLSKSPLGTGGYFLPDRRRAEAYRERKTGTIGLTTWVPRAAGEGWFDAGRWLDLAGAVVEHGRIPDFRVDSFDCERIREFLSRVSGFSKRDRAGWLSYSSQSSFGLSISKKGVVRLFVHSLQYVDDVSVFLSECGLSDVRKRLFFERFFARCGEAKVSVEMNVLASREELPDSFVVETQVGGDVIRSRLNYSGGNSELETSGALAPAHNFLLHLAGVQHGTAVEYLQAKTLAEIRDKFDIMATALENAARELRKSRDTEKETPSEEEEKEPPKGDFYG